MPLRRDASIELYGFRTWDSLLPWDPMSTDMPTRVAPLLEQEFLDLWAEPRSDEVASLVADHGPPAGTRAVAPPRATDRGSDRKLRAAERRATLAQQRLEAAEAEARAARQRREGFEAWVETAREQLGAAQRDAAAARDRRRAAADALDALRAELEAARGELAASETEAQASGRGVGAVRGVVRVVRATKRVLKLEERLREQEEQLLREEEEERARLGELAVKEASLERALEKVEESAQLEAQARRRLTQATRAAARASLAVQELREELGRAGETDVDPDLVVLPEADADGEGAPPPVDPAEIARAEKEVEAARLDLAAIEGEARAAAEMVEAIELEVGSIQRAFLGAEEALRGERALLAQAEAEVAEALRGGDGSGADEDEAELASRTARGGIEGVRGSLVLGVRHRRTRRRRRREREAEAVLEIARRRVEEAEARFTELARALEGARDRLAQARRVETEARRSLGLARQRYGRVVGLLSKLTAKAGHRPERTPFAYIILVRDQQLLGSLSLPEWARRATGHGTEPRFILEREGEALWLYRGEWFSADPDLRVDDITVLLEASDPRLQTRLDTETAAHVWERDAGRCVRCGAVGNLVIDHIIPVVLGGSDAPSNLQLLCRNCSRDKSHQL
ncbi:MAG TPA: HNH endonuclease [Actinomycetota bacterium]|nr:HNH endonuclease [Actinomycetota bacterium]